MKHQLERRFSRRARGGSVLVLVSVCLVIIFGFAALAVDLGVASVAVAECQRTADAAALAAAGGLIPEAPDETPDDRADEARAEAIAFSLLNEVLHEPVVVDANWYNDPEGDVVLGRVDPTNPRNTFVATTVNVNAVKVRVRRDGDLNPPLPAFFSRVFGINGLPAHRYALAMIIDRVKGFRSPGEETLNLLPFVVKKEDWEALLAGVGTDNYAYDPDTGTVSVGSDGVLELRMYPQTESNSNGNGKGKGCCGGGVVPGNFGTVDIGNTNNSTADLKRQILEGVSAEDLEWHGGRLELGPDGTLVLNGDTGISASIQSALEQIKGKPRVIMLYSDVSGNGNNAMFTIVKFVGVRVMDVDLTGSMSDKHVTVQPAPVVTTHAIASETEGTSYGIYSTVRLVE